MEVGDFVVDAKDVIAAGEIYTDEHDEVEERSSYPWRNGWRFGDDVSAILRVTHISWQQQVAIGICTCLRVRIGTFSISEKMDLSEVKYYMLRALVFSLQTLLVQDLSQVIVWVESGLSRDSGRS